jgi:hypothetical protein
MALNFKENNMPTLSTRNQLLLASLLIGLLVITRLPVSGSTEFSATWIPVSTIGLFFLMGVYFRQIWLLTLTFALVWTMDITGMTWQGDSDFCLRESYLFLLLSYAVYWASGRLFATLYAGENLTSLGLLMVIAPIGAALGYLVASAGFHYFSMRADLGISAMLSDYVDRLPTHLEGLAVYLMLALVIHMAIITWSKRLNQAHQLS